MGVPGEPEQGDGGEGVACLRWEDLAGVRRSELGDQLERAGRAWSLLPDYFWQPMLKLSRESRQRIEENTGQESEQESKQNIEAGIPKPTAESLIRASHDQKPSPKDAGAGEV